MSDPTQDAAGNMTSVPKPSSLSAAYTLTYDAWNRLVKVQDGAATVATFEYDALGRRTKKVAGGVTYDYYHNEAWQVVEVRKNGSANPLEQFAWHAYYIDAPLVRFYDSNTDGAGIVEHYYGHDAQFNVTVVHDVAANVVERYTYTPYGELLIMNASWSTLSSSAIGNSYTYTGREYDSETGLFNFRARYYHAQLGRFVNRDPIGYRDGFNLYGSYWAVNGADPSGLGTIIGVGQDPIIPGMPDPGIVQIDARPTPPSPTPGIYSGPTPITGPVVGRSEPTVPLHPLHPPAAPPLSPFGPFQHHDQYAFGVNPNAAIPSSMFPPGPPDPSPPYQPWLHEPNYVPGFSLFFGGPVIRGAGKLLGAVGRGAGRLFGRCFGRGAGALDDAVGMADDAAHNAASFERYKDALRAGMDKPHVTDPKLSGYLDELYRPNAQIGSGSTAAAVRHELVTGEPVGGAFHSQKARDMIKALENWLKNHPDAAPGDRAAAENVIPDMQNALGGY